MKQNSKLAFTIVEIIVASLILTATVFLIYKFNS